MYCYLQAGLQCGVTHKVTNLIISPGGTVIGSVFATDRDLPTTDIQYSLVSGGGSGGLANIFHVDPKLGRISLLTNPDYEVTPSHTLVIRVVDGDPIRPLSATAVVSHKMEDSIDNILTGIPLFVKNKNITELCFYISRLQSISQKLMTNLHCAVLTKPTWWYPLTCVQGPASKASCCHAQTKTPLHLHSSIQS